MVTHPQGVQPDVMHKIVDFTSCSGPIKGNHNESDVAEVFAGVHLRGVQSRCFCSIRRSGRRRGVSLFDPNFFEPMITAKIHSPGLSPIEIKEFRGAASIEFAARQRAGDGKLVEEGYWGGNAGR